MSGRGIIVKDYLFVQPFFDPPGGGEGVANWMLQVLSERGSVTTLSWRPPDWERIDAYYGTSLSQAKIRSVLVAPTLKRLLEWVRVPHQLLALSLLMGKAKRLRSDYRFCLSSYNELDLGGGAVQYLHFPCQDFRRIRAPSFVARSRARLFWPLYLAVCRWVLGWKLQSVLSNVTIANSQWTANEYAKAYGKQVDFVIFPPPLGGGYSSSLARTNTFLSIARITRFKNWLGLIRVFDEVHARGLEVGLTLVGSREDDSLLAELQFLQKSRPWLTLVVDQPRHEVDRLISCCKYGIHAAQGEPYGMAVAELVLGGCLTLVHDSGGQVEIVTDFRARYVSEDDAVAKICALVQSPDLQQELAENQHHRALDLTREKFIANFESFLDAWES